MIVSKLFHRLTKGLYIDNRNINDPIVTADYFETQQKGYSIFHLLIKQNKYLLKFIDGRNLSKF